MSEEIKSPQVEDELEIKSEIEHVLDRPGTWVGSLETDVIDYPLFVPSKNKMELVKNVGYNEALLKLIDEVISNSVDEHRRDTARFKVNKISVEFNTNGYVRIEDNGGIGVTYHPKVKTKLRPEIMFGQLRTSTNYNDTKERTVVGTNGLGAKLTNIFSKKFTVETHDTANGVVLEWSNNMGNFAPYETFKSKEHKTITTFEIDLPRFDMESVPLSVIRLVQKRCIEGAGTNPGLQIDFKSDVADGKLDSSWKFNDFKEYVHLYLTPEQIASSLHYRESSKFETIIVPEATGTDFGFVNGAICSLGTHVNKVKREFADAVLAICQKMDMEHLTDKDIFARCSFYINTTIVNPAYGSQTKEKLTTKIPKYNMRFSQKFLKDLKNAPIIDAMKDFYLVKYAELKKKELRKLNGTLKTTKIKKLIQCASKAPEQNELWLFEGNSASNGFRNARNLFQAGYLLRGKIKNTFNLKKTQILENQELKEVIAALGILFNEPKKNLKNIKFKKVIIGTDMDHDGNHICGLLIAFFAVHFPEIIKAGYLYRALSPIVIARHKTKPNKYYYTMREYELDANLLKGYTIKYTKGLGGLNDEDYKTMVRQQKLIQFTMNDIADKQSINVWFDKSTDQRKELLIEDNEVA